MKHIYLLIFALGLSSLHAQEIMSGSSLTFDFERFQGGFVANPTLNELDSDSWTLSGFNPIAFVPGGTHNTGDYLPRQTRGGVGTAGVYALAYTSEDTAIWFQGTGTDFTPGIITLAVQNMSGAAFHVLTITYDVLVLNDQNRSQSIDFEFSTDGIVFTSYESFLTTETADTTPFVEVYPQGTALDLAGLGAPLNHGDIFYLRWTTDDHAGIGARDEWGLDNIRIRNLAPISPTQLAYTATPLFLPDGVTYEVEVCATNGADRDVNFEGSTLSLAAAPAAGATIADGPSYGGCKTFYVTGNMASSPQVVLTASEPGILSDAITGAIPLTAGSVFFSEYLEGSGESRCLEVYNGTGIPVDLGVGGYAIQFYTDGNPDGGSPLALTGMLGAGEVQVICAEDAGPMFLAQADVMSTLLDFDGNDGIELLNSFGTLDFIGRFDDDSYWGTSPCETQNATLIRQAGRLNGDREPRDAFDPVDEWDCEAKNAWAYLGYHDDADPNPIVATQLAINYFPQRCLDTRGYMRVEVCAQDAMGFTQPDYADPILISASGASTPLILASSASQTPIYGCATFYFRHQTVETITLSFTSGSLSPASEVQTFGTGCHTPRIITGAYDVCGNESQNEYMIMRNGPYPLDIGDLDIGILDRHSGSGGIMNQPNYVSTWNISQTLTPDNPNSTISATNATHRLLNVNAAGDLTVMADIKATLDALAPACGASPFFLPSAGGVGGTVPPNGLMLVWLGAGGTGTAGSHGLDTTGLGLNYDFYCDSTLYLLVGERSTSFGGFASNSDDRTYRVMLGLDSVDLAYQNPSDGSELKSISEDGTQLMNQECDAVYALDNTPLPVAWLKVEASSLPNGQVLIAWATDSEEHNHYFKIERMETQGGWDVLGQKMGQGSIKERTNYEFIDKQPHSGVNMYRIRQVDFEGQFSYSPTVEVDLKSTDGLAGIDIYPQPASQELKVEWFQPQSAQVDISIHSLYGQQLFQEHTEATEGRAFYALNVDFLPVGTYLFSLVTPFGRQVQTVTISR